MPSTDANEPSFVVTDRRHFTPEGERRTDVPENSTAAAIEIGAPPPRPAAAGAKPSAPRGQGKSKPVPAAAPPPPEPAPEAAGASDDMTADEPGGSINFSSFLESLYASAMMQLGAAAPGQISRAEADFEGARQTIEVIGLLQRKTRGNLTAEEMQVLEEILYELRLAFVELTRKRAR